MCITCEKKVMKLRVNTYCLYQIKKITFVHSLKNTNICLYWKQPLPENGVNGKYWFAPGCMLHKKRGNRPFSYLYLFISTIS